LKVWDASDLFCERTGINKNKKPKSVETEDYEISHKQQLTVENEKSFRNSSSLNKSIDHRYDAETNVDDQNMRYVIKQNV
jgi:hypothetical protein